VERGTPGRPYNVSSGTAYAIGEILDRLISKARLKVGVRVDPSRLRPNDIPVFVGDSDTAARRARMGKPAIELERTLTDVLDYWRGVLTV